MTVGPSACEQHDGGGVEEGTRGGEGRFRIFPEPPVSADPGEEAFDHPSARVDREADLVAGFSDDLDGDGGRRRRTLSGEAHIRERLGDEWERAPRQT